MKIHHLLLTTILVLSLTIIPAQAKSLIVGLSPFQHKDIQKTHIQTVLGYLCHQNDYDEAVFIDAYNLVTIGTFVIPEDKAYNNAKARLKVNRKMVADLIRFNKIQHNPQSSDTFPTTKGSIRFPQFSAYIAKQFAGSDNTLLIIGSPIYDVPKDTAYSMIGNTYPSDGHIRSTRNMSLFGTSGTPNLMNNWLVYWINSDTDSFLNSQYQYAVERFWHLYISSQGGLLQHISSDLTGILASLKRAHTKPARKFILDTLSKREMIMVLDKVANIREQNVTPVTSTNNEIANPRDAKGAKISLSWDCHSCDLDLYVRQKNGDVVYFQNTESEHATFYKQIRELKATNKGFEVVVFNKKIDLTGLRIAVNFFSGNAPSGVNGQISIHYDGITKQQNFNLVAKQGSEVSDIEFIFDPQTISEHVYQLNLLDTFTQQIGGTDD